MKLTQYDYSQCTPIVSSGSHYYYNPFKSSYLNIRYNLSAGKSYTITIGDVGRLPNIAYRFYGNANLWRILCQVNQISDPINDIYPGRVINIPSLAEITNLINTNNNTTAASAYFNSTFVI